MYHVMQNGQESSIEDFIIVKRDVIVYLRVVVLLVVNSFLINKMDPVVMEVVRDIMAARLQA